MRQSPARIISPLAWYTSARTPPAVLRRREVGYGGFEAWTEKVYEEEARTAEKLDAKEREDVMALLSDEQKATFNRLGRNTAQSGG